MSRPASTSPTPSEPGKPARHLTPTDSVTPLRAKVRRDRTIFTWQITAAALLGACLIFAAGWIVAANREPDRPAMTPAAQPVDEGLILEADAKDAIDRAKVTTARKTKQATAAATVECAVAAMMAKHPRTGLPQMIEVGVDHKLAEMSGKPDAVKHAAEEHDELMTRVRECAKG